MGNKTGQTQVCLNTSKTYENTEMSLVNIRHDKLLIKKETGFKIDFKRLKNILRGSGFSKRGN